MITVKTEQLKAAMYCAAVKDVRYYLKGVLLERCANGDAHIVGTDGHCLFAGLIAAQDVQDCDQNGPWRMIVPLDAIKAAIKTKRPMMRISALPDGRYTLGDVIFTPVDGTYPDWRRVVPYNACVIAGESVACLDPDLMTRAFDAVRTWHNMRPTSLPAYKTFGSACTFVSGPDCTGFAVVMPYRTKPGDWCDPFTAANYGA